MKWIVLSFLLFLAYIPCISQPKTITKPLNIGLDNQKGFEKIYYENSSEGRKIVSYNGYVFKLDKDFVPIEISNDIILIWFPEYQAYFSLRHYDEIRKGARAELHLETCRLIVGDKSVSDGRCLLCINFSDNTARVYLDGKLSDFKYDHIEKREIAGTPVNVFIYKSPTHDFIIRDIILDECKYVDFCFSPGDIQ
jgi:hypothetical protein